MLLNSNSYRRAEVEGEPHNLLVDFCQDFSFGGPDRSFETVHFELPYPVGGPLEAWQGRDPLQQLLEDKEQYKKVLKGCSKGLLQDVEGFSCPSKSGGLAQYKYMPQQLLDVYQHQDPDEDFDYDYNLYYTNGVLDGAHLNGCYYVVWAKFDGSVQFLNTALPTDCFSLRVTGKGPIFCLRSYSVQEDCFLLLRLKCEVILVKILLPPAFLITFRDSFPEPIRDAKLAGKGQHLGLITAKSGFFIKDLRSNKVIFKPKQPSKVVQFEFWGQSTVILMESLVVKFWDYSKKTLLKTFDPQLMPCNQLCNLRISGQSLLLASRHYLLKANMEDLQDFSTFAHTLAGAPLYMDVLDTGEDCYVCLSGHCQDSKVLFVGNTAFGLPYKVPDVKATLDQAILGNPALLLQENVAERLSFSTAGLKLIEGAGQVVVYFPNSIGELFQQQISSSALDSSEPVDRLCAWIEQLTVPPQPLYVTNFVEMGQVFTMLSKSVGSCVNSPQKPTASQRKTKTDQFLAAFRSKYSKSQVKSTFGHGFLEVWSDSEESDEELPSISAPELPFYDKVSSWMERHDNEMDIKDVND